VSLALQRKLNPATLTGTADDDLIGNRSRSRDSVSAPEDESKLKNLTNQFNENSVADLIPSIISSTPSRADQSTTDENM